MINLSCPSCHESFGLPLALAGRPFTCPVCRVVTKIPQTPEVQRPGPDAATKIAAVLTCPRCSRVVNVNPILPDGWVDCPSCSPILAPAPTGRSENSVMDEPDVSPPGDWDVVRRLRVRRARKRLRRRLILGGLVAGVMLLVLGGLAVRSALKPRTARQILTHLKGQKLIDRDVYVAPSREFDNRPAWLLFYRGAVGAILLEFEDEGDARAYPIGHPYRRFVIVPYPDADPAFAEKLYRSLP